MQNRRSQEEKDVCSIRASTRASSASLHTTRSGNTLLQGWQSLEQISHVQIIHSYLEALDETTLTWVKDIMITKWMWTQLMGTENEIQLIYFLPQD